MSRYCTPRRTPLGLDHSRSTSEMTSIIAWACRLFQSSRLTVSVASPSICSGRPSVSASTSSRLLSALKRASRCCCADAAGLDRLDLQPGQPQLDPAHQVEELLAFDRRRHLAVALPGVIDPVLRTRAEQQRVLEPLGLEVARQVLVWPHALGAGVQTAV